MGLIKKHLPVKLIIGIAYCLDFNVESVITKLEELQSPVDIRSKTYNFSNFTPYYAEEMGKNLSKCFVAFLDLINPDELPLIKVKTNAMEEKYFIDKKRRVNVDPGYLSQAKLVLATTKNYSHRIYLGQGIFGDVHLHFSNKSYQSQAWTYPDYKDKNNVVFFNSVRKKYLEQLAKI